MTASHETPLVGPGGAASAGQAPGRPYIDVHAHLGETINRVPPVGQSAEKYLARMAQSGVVAAIPCPAAGGPQARGVLDTRDEAEAIAGACRRYPRRFPLGLANLEVRHQRAGVDELERGMAESGANPDPNNRYGSTPRNASVDGRAVSDAPETWLLQSWRPAPNSHRTITWDFRRTAHIAWRTWVGGVRGFISR